MWVERLAAFRARLPILGFQTTRFHGIVQESSCPRFADCTGVLGAAAFHASNPPAVYQVGLHSGPQLIDYLAVAATAQSH
jgi:hypothetical protein